MQLVGAPKDRRFWAGRQGSLATAVGDSAGDTSQVKVLEI